MKRAVRIDLMMCAWIGGHCLMMARDTALAEGTKEGLNSLFDGEVSQSGVPVVDGPGAALPANVEVERIRELEKAAGKAFKIFDDDESSRYIKKSPNRQAALDILIQAGILPGMHVGNSYDNALKGDAASRQKLEWYLGQVLAIAQEVSKTGMPTDINAVLDMSGELWKMSGGWDIGRSFAERTETNKWRRQAFADIYKERGFIQSKGRDGQFKDLFDADDVNPRIVPKLVGREVAFMVEIPPYPYDLDSIVGRITNEGQRNRACCVVVDTGKQQTEVNLNEVREFLVEDTSPITVKQFRKNARDRDFIAAGSPEYIKINGSSHLDAHALEGRTGSFLMANQDKGQWEVLEGVIRPNGTARWGAIFLLEMQGSVREMNSNDVKDHYMSDISPLTPRQFRDNARHRNYIKVNLSSRSWAQGFSGHHALVLLLDQQAKIYKVLEGVMRPEPAGSAVFILETHDGHEALNTGFIEEMWVSP